MKREALLKAISLLTAIFSTSAFGFLGDSQVKESSQVLPVETLSQNQKAYFSNLLGVNLHHNEFQGAMLFVNGSKVRILDENANEIKTDDGIDLARDGGDPC
ncbi:MAG: hypothetical protein IPK04_01320 [Bdellovibrionales bacterium]|nr:hypothetical protein [Bdellovibrionales bacterium]